MVETAEIQASQDFGNAPLVQKVVQRDSRCPLGIVLIAVDHLLVCLAGERRSVSRAEGQVPAAALPSPSGRVFAARDTGLVLVDGDLVALAPRSRKYLLEVAGQPKLRDMQRRQEYSSDVEGGAPVRVRWSISGRMNMPSYLDFVVDRARWLGLDGWVAANDDATVSLAVAGPEAMVGALEMACTLGPLDALIDEVRSVGEPSELLSGFSIRQK